MTITAIVSDSSVTAVVPSDEGIIVEVAQQGVAGPPGADGADGAAPQVTVTAGETLGGHRAVVLNADGEAIYADSATVAHAGRLLGMTTGAASLGADVVVRNAGEITEGSWAWQTDRPIFVGTTGTLTQTPPTTGFTQQIAVPITATRILISIQTPFIR